MNKLVSSIEIKNVLVWLTFLCLLSVAHSLPVADLFFVLIFSALLALAIFNKQGVTFGNLFLSTGFDLLWVVFLGVIAVGYTSGIGWGKEQINNFFEFRWILGIYVIARVFTIIRIDVKKMEILLVALGLSCLFFFVSYAVKPGEVVPGFGFPNRLKGNFVNTIDFANFFQIPMLFTLALLVCSRPCWGRRFKTLMLSLVVVFGVGIFFTFCRGVWMALMVTIPLVIFLGNRKSFVKLASVWGGALAFLYISNFAGFRDRINFTFRAHDTYDNWRLTLWDTNFYIFKTSPWFGIGYWENTRQLRQYYDALGIPKGFFEGHAHSQVLNFLAGTGLLGTLSYFLIFFGFILMSWKNFSFFKAKEDFNSALSLGSFGALVSFLVSGFADCNLEMNGPRYFLIATWGLVLYQKTLREVLS